MQERFFYKQIIIVNPVLASDRAHQFLSMVVLDLPPPFPPRSRYLVLLDAAAYLPTSALDLSKHQAGPSLDHTLSLPCAYAPPAPSPRSREMPRLGGVAPHQPSDPSHRSSGTTRRQMRIPRAWFLLFNNIVCAVPLRDAPQPSRGGSGIRHSMANGSRR